ncbi:MAG: ATP-binding protein, partial [Bacteroidota bacterium]
ELKTIDWISLIDPEDLPVYREYSDRLLSGEPAEAEFKVRRRDGVIRWVRAKSFPEWHEAMGRVVRIDGAGQDITAQKKLEIELFEQKETAEEMTRLKDAFLANMSHEIRTPLTSILGAADLLRTEVSGETQQLVDFIQKGGERLMETLSSVLDLAQLEGRALRFNVETVDVVREAERVVMAFQPRATEKGLDLRFSAEDQADLQAELDRAALGRVLTNLLSNALKFTEVGHVSLRLERRGNELAIQVQDTGVGISSEFLPHIFDEFRQESTGLDRGFEGTGLGLTITRRLVELMGGRISVRSERGVGTTVTVRLPVLEKKPVIEAPTDDDPKPSDLGILMVDDDPAVRDIVRYILGEANDVDAAATGDEALDLIRSKDYDAVFLDINLGRGETGEMVLERLRDRQTNRHIPVIALTAYALPGDRTRFLAEGFDGYVAKPFRASDLTNALHEVLIDPAS